MSKFLSHAYGNVMSAISKAWKDNRSLANILNWYVRNIENIFPELGKKSAVEYLEALFPEAKVDWNDMKQRIKAIASIRMVRYLCRFQMIELWNPRGEEVGLLGLVELDRLAKLEEEGKGGITPYRIGQIAYHIGTEYAKLKGDAYDIENLNDDERKKAHKIIKGIAKKYHAKANKKRNLKLAEANQESSDNTVKVEERGDVTVEAILNGTVQIKEVDNHELLNEAYEASKGGQKGAIKRRINALLK